PADTSDSESLSLHDALPIWADRLGEASAEVGLVFLTVGLATGTIWGRVIWGAWWVWWDMRLTLTLFLWFVTAAYLVLRGAIEEEDRKSTRLNSSHLVISYAV